MDINIGNRSIALTIILYFQRINCSSFMVTKEFRATEVETTVENLSDCCEHVFSPENDLVAK